MCGIISGFIAAVCSILRHFSGKEENADALLGELADLGASKPTIISFGKDAHDLMERYVPSSAYGRLVRVTHYSDYMGKEQYRDVVARELQQRE